MSLFNFGTKNKLGIDIGTSSIKIVELSKQAGRFKLENYGLFELENDDQVISSSESPLAKNTKHFSDQQMALAIKEVLNKTGINSREAIASLPSLSTFATIISMPYLSEQDIAKTIPFEARKYVPIPLSEVVMDWSIVNVSQNSQVKAGSNPTTVDVFLVAVPKEETKRYQNIMKEAGVNLRALEIENTALIRSVIGNDLSPTAIVSIGGQSTSIIIVEGGVQRVSHNYEVGSMEITRSISRTLNISLKRAEDLKRKLGLKEGDDNTIRPIISSMLDLIIFETNKTMHNYEDLKKSKIGKIFLVGGLANMVGFTEYFSSKIGIPSDAANPLARIVSPQHLEPIRKELNSTFAVAFGLAMREI